MNFDYNRVVSASDVIGIASRATERFLMYLYEHEGDVKINVQRQLGLPDSVMAYLIDNFSGVVVRDAASLNISERGKEYVMQLAQYRAEKDMEIATKLPLIE